MLLENLLRKVFPGVKYGPSALQCCWIYSRKGQTIVYYCVMEGVALGWKLDHRTPGEGSKILVDEAHE